jgi:4-hydroxy-3-polyprenylbenzoate decarboxylase
MACFVVESEEMEGEGPFGYHTGFTSLANWYSRFQVTCRTESKKAVYPATIVGIPPQEDAWIARATERLFLAPVKMTLQPEIEDFHMPDAGVAHNLVIVKIRKNYPGQGMKVLSSLAGAGQMMFTKYMIVVSGSIDIRDYKALMYHVFENVDFGTDMLFSNGPLDVLDHSSDNFSYGGKAGIDATIKMEEELAGRSSVKSPVPDFPDADFQGIEYITHYNSTLLSVDSPVLIISVDRSKDPGVIEKVRDHFKKNDPEGNIKLIIAVDHTVDVRDLFTVAWQLLGNTDPRRDHLFLSRGSVLFDATIKVYRSGGFPRKWPNIVCSDEATISKIDRKWGTLGLGELIDSPSARYNVLLREGADEIIRQHIT